MTLRLFKIYFSFGWIKKKLNFFFFYFYICLKSKIKKSQHKSDLLTNMFNYVPIK